MTKAKMASLQEIVDYWSTRKYEGDLGVDWSDAHERCWRCGYIARLDRCHVIPESLGGSCGAENLALLCKACHKEAPNINDSSFFWEWIRSTRTEMYDTFWVLRTFEEYEKVFKKKPFTDIKLKNVKQAIALYKEELNNCIVHYGESGINISTRVAIFKRLEDKLK